VPWNGGQTRHADDVGIDVPRKRGGVDVILVKMNGQGPGCNLYNSL
jgi:hypothetical protein